MTIAEASGEYFVTGDRGELAGHAIADEHGSLSLWVPGPGPAGPPVATIDPEGDVRAAIVSAVREAQERLALSAGSDQEIETDTWSMPMVVGLALSALIIVAMIVDVIRMAIPSD